MDAGGPEIINGMNGEVGKVACVEDSKEDGVFESADGQGDEENGESNALVLPAIVGCLAGKRQKSLRRNVQWNDSKGEKLFEVLEFEPSDSSDSEDDSSYKLSTWNLVFISCIQLCCCLGYRRSQ